MLLSKGESVIYVFSSTGVLIPGHSWSVSPWKLFCHFKLLLQQHSSGVERRRFRRVSLTFIFYFTCVYFLVCLRRSYLWSGKPKVRSAVEGACWEKKVKIATSRLAKKRNIFSLSVGDNRDVYVCVWRGGGRGSEGPITALVKTKEIISMKSTVTNC